MKLFLIIFAFVASYAFADNSLTLKTYDGKMTTDIFIKGDMLRFVLTDYKSKQRVSIFNNSNQKLVMINPKTQRFIIVDQALIDKQKQMLAMQMQVMKERIPFLPKDKQAIIKQKLALFGPSTGRIKMPDIKFEMTGKYSKVSGFVCEKVNVFIAEQLEKELCIADAEALNMEKREFNTLKSFFEFMKRGNGQTSPENIPQISGIPISTKGFKGQESSGLKAISYEKLSDTLFKVPETYKQIGFIKETD